jgi:hypothetical protein
MSLLCSDVYDLLLDELRTDKRGLSCEIPTFNRLLRLVNYEIYDQYLTDFEKDQSNADSLGWFKVHNFGIDLTLGVGTLPINYYRLIGKPRILDGTTYRKVDLVTTFEQACRDDDFLTQATTLHPTATIGGVNATQDVQIRVSPTTATKVWVDYMKMLDTPYLDYYINNQTYNFTYLAESSALQAIPAGSTYRDGTVGAANVTSLTKDLVWDEGDLPLIITKLVNRVAKQLPDELLLQTSMAEQIKSES